MSRRLRALCEDARLRKHALQLTPELLWFLAKIVLTKPLDARPDLSHVAEVHNGLAKVHCADRLVVGESFEERADLFQSATICFCRRIREFVVSSERSAKERLRALECLRDGSAITQRELACAMLLEFEPE